MRLYTSKEIWEDLRQFERSFSVPEPSGIQHLRFTRLWSEYYGTPVKDLDPQNVRSNIRNRIQAFLAREKLVLPAVNKYPNEAVRFTVYTTEENSPPSRDVKLFYLGEMNSFDLFISTMSMKYIPENKILYYTDSKYREVKIVICHPGSVPDAKY